MSCIRIDSYNELQRGHWQVAWIADESSAMTYQFGELDDCFSENACF